MSNIVIEVDFGGVEDGLGAVKSIVAALDKKSNLNRIANHIANKGRFEFGLQMDMAARADPRSFAHLYEWDGVGQKTKRLFNVVLTRAAEGNVTVTSNFIESSMPVEERPLVGQKIPVRIKNEDGSWVFRRLEVFPNQQQHVFRDKASVMEAGTTVNIKTVHAKKLFWVDPEKRRGIMVPEISIDYSKKPTFNQFTESWDVFWDVMVDQLVIEPAVKRIESSLQPVVDAIIAKESAKSNAKTLATQGRGIGAGSVRVLKNGKPFSRLVPRRSKAIERQVTAAVARALQAESEI